VLATIAMADAYIRASIARAPFHNTHENFFFFLKKILPMGGETKGHEIGFNTLDPSRSVKKLIN
jgi:hypothetical protein